MRVKTRLFAAVVAVMIAVSFGSEAAFAKFPEIDFSKFSFDRLKSKIFKDDTPVVVKKYVYKKADGSINRDNDGRLVYIYGRFSHLEMLMIL